MSSMLRLLPATFATACLLAGCANGTSPFGATTASVDQPKSSPACVTLNSKIDALRNEGVTDRAAQAAATGKSATLQVKRTSLAQLAELDKANAEFQAKCSTVAPRTASAGSATVPAASAVAAATHGAAASVVAAAPAAKPAARVAAAKPVTTTAAAAPAQ